MRTLTPEREKEIREANEDRFYRLTQAAPFAHDIKELLAEIDALRLEISAWKAGYNNLLHSHDMSIGRLTRECNQGGSGHISTETVEFQRRCAKKE
jgi:hypothetical protein